MFEDWVLSYERRRAPYVRSSSEGTQGRLQPCMGATGGEILAQKDAEPKVSQSVQEPGLVQYKGRPLSGRQKA